MLSNIMVIMSNNSDFQKEFPVNFILLEKVYSCKQTSVVLNNNILPTTNKDAFNNFINNIILPNNKDLKFGKIHNNLDTVLDYVTPDDEFQICNAINLNDIRDTFTVISRDNNLYDYPIVYVAFFLD